MKKSVALACAVLLGMLVFGPAATPEETFWPSDAELIAAVLAFVLLVLAALALVVGAISSHIKHRHGQGDPQASRTESEA